MEVEMNSDTDSMDEPQHPTTDNMDDIDNNQDTFLGKRHIRQVTEISAIFTQDAGDPIDYHPESLFCKQLKQKLFQHWNWQPPTFRELFKAQGVPGLSEFRRIKSSDIVELLTSNYEIDVALGIKIYCDFHSFLSGRQHYDAKVAFRNGLYQNQHNFDIHLNVLERLLKSTPGCRKYYLRYVKLLIVQLVFVSEHQKVENVVSTVAEFIKLPVEKLWESGGLRIVTFLSRHHKEILLTRLPDIIEDIEIELNQAIQTLVSIGDLNTKEDLLGLPANYWYQLLAILYGLQVPYTRDPPDLLADPRTSSYALRHLHPLFHSDPDEAVDPHLPLEIPEPQLSPYTPTARIGQATSPAGQWTHTLQTTLPLLFYLWWHTSTLEDDHSLAAATAAQTTHTRRVPSAVRTIVKLLTDSRHTRRIVHAVVGGSPGVADLIVALLCDCWSDTIVGSFAFPAPCVRVLVERGALHALLAAIKQEHRKPEERMRLFCTYAAWKLVTHEKSESEDSGMTKNHEPENISTIFMGIARNEGLQTTNPILGPAISFMRLLTTNSPSYHSFNYREIHLSLTDQHLSGVALDTCNQTHTGLIAHTATDGPIFLYPESATRLNILSWATRKTVPGFKPSRTLKVDSSPSTCSETESMSFSSTNSRSTTEKVLMHFVNAGSNSGQQTEVTKQEASVKKRRKDLQLIEILGSQQRTFVVPRAIRSFMNPFMDCSVSPIITGNRLAVHTRPGKYICSPRPRPPSSLQAGGTPDSRSYQAWTISDLRISEHPVRGTHSRREPLPEPGQPNLRAVDQFWQMVGNIGDKRLHILCCENPKTRKRLGLWAVPERPLIQHRTWAKGSAGLWSLCVAENTVCVFVPKLRRYSTPLTLDQQVDGIAASHDRFAVLTTTKISIFEVRVGPPHRQEKGVTTNSTDDARASGYNRDENPNQQQQKVEVVHTHSVDATFGMPYSLIAFADVHTLCAFGVNAGLPVLVVVDLDADCRSGEGEVGCPEAHDADTRTPKVRVVYGHLGFAGTLKNNKMANDLGLDKFAFFFGCHTNDNLQLLTMPWTLMDQGVLDKSVVPRLGWVPTKQPTKKADERPEKSIFSTFKNKIHKAAAQNYIRPISIAADSSGGNRSVLVLFEWSPDLQDTTQVIMVAFKVNVSAVLRDALLIN